MPACGQNLWRGSLVWGVGGYGCDLPRGFFQISRGIYFRFTCTQKRKRIQIETRQYLLYNIYNIIYNKNSFSRHLFKHSRVVRLHFGSYLHHNKPGTIRVYTIQAIAQLYTEPSHHSERLGMKSHPAAGLTGLARRIRSHLAQGLRAFWSLATPVLVLF